MACYHVRYPSVIVNTRDAGNQIRVLVLVYHKYRGALPGGIHPKP